MQHCYNQFKSGQLVAIVEWGSSLMNLVMNDLRSCMNIAILDVLMRITYVNGITDDAVDSIIGIWKECGNRQIELWSHLWKKEVVLFLLTFYMVLCEFNQLYFPLFWLFQKRCKKIWFFWISSPFLPKKTYPC